MKVGLIFLSLMMLTGIAHAQLVLDGDCQGEDFIGKAHQTGITYFGFCDWDESISILDPKTKTYFNGLCLNGELKGKNTKTGETLSGTCTRNGL